MIREVTAVGHGPGRDESGDLCSESGVRAETLFSFKTGVARQDHAGCEANLVELGKD